MSVAIRNIGKIIVTMQAMNGNNMISPRYRSLIKIAMLLFATEHYVEKKDFACMAILPINSKQKNSPRHSSFL